MVREGSGSCALVVRAAQTQDHRIMLSTNSFAAGKETPNTCWLCQGFVSATVLKSISFLKTQTLSTQQTGSKKHTGDGDCATKALPVFSFPPDKPDLKTHGYGSPWGFKGSQEKTGVKLSPSGGHPSQL